MSEIAIFYGSSTGNTEIVAKIIQEKLGADKADLYDVAHIKVEDLRKYSFIILGTSTWGIGGMQDDWEDAVDLIGKVDFAEKKVALFGLGDQEEYPDTFADALGTLYRRVLKRGACIIGEWPADDYTFEKSRAYREGSFVGLVIDQDNQADLTEERVSDWVEMVTSAL